MLIIGFSVFVGAILIKRGKRGKMVPIEKRRGKRGSASSRSHQSISTTRRWRKEEKREKTNSNRQGEGKERRGSRHLTFIAHHNLLNDVPGGGGEGKEAKMKRAHAMI